MYELTKLFIRNFELLENRKIRSGPGEILCILMAEFGVLRVLTTTHPFRNLQLWLFGLFCCDWPKWYKSASWGN